MTTAGTEQSHQSHGPYSKKLQGRVSAALDDTGVPLLDGVQESRLRGRHINAEISGSEYPAGLTEAQRGGFNVALPRNLSALVLGDKAARKRAYVRGIGAADAANTFEIAKKISMPDSDTKLVSRVVFGATTEMPLRALSYLVPALVHAKHLEETAGVRPQVQAVFVDNISGKLNRLNPDHARSQSQRLADVTRRYVETFFPDLQDDVLFLRDRPLDKGSVLRDELGQVAAAALSVNGDLAEQLRARGKSRIDGRLARFYASAHILVHDTDRPDFFTPMYEDQPDMVPADALLSFGGLQEQLFYRVRQELKPELGAYADLPTVQFFSDHHVPPYAMASGGDISLSAALGGETIDGQVLAKAARHDLDYLLGASYSFNGTGTIDFEAFLATVGTNNEQVIS